MKKLDFLAIGDITTDAFIKLKDAEVHCEVDHTNCKLCVRFGDKIPYQEVTIVRAVGNSPNGSVSAARLGLRSGLLAYIGSDRNGEECVEELKRNNIDTTLVRKQEGKSTNYHYVLWYEVDRTILVKHENFEYDLGDIGEPKWIYLSSLGQNALEFHHQIAEYLKNNPGIRLAFQPGTFQIQFGRQELKDIYSQTEVFFSNIEEAQKILETKEKDAKKLMEEMAKLGPKNIFITDGINGAYAYDSDGFWFIPVYPGKPYERTGAGDAFASTVVSALALGKPIEEALMWGPINSMSVVREIGAQKGLLTREQLEEYLKNAPADYKPKKI